MINKLSSIPWVWGDKVDFIYIYIYLQTYNVIYLNRVSHSKPYS